MELARKFCLAHFRLAHFRPELALERVGASAGASVGASAGASAWELALERGS